MDRRQYWENIHATKGPDDVSWFEPHASRSLALIERIMPDRAATLIDVGAGASTLVDGLLDSGYHNITVLDISSAALDRARRRLGERVASAKWIAADILSVDLPSAAFDVWHDRAVFHFLTSEMDPARYVRQLRFALRPGGYAIIATFAEDGPTRCSGLDVVRYSGVALHDVLGHDFQPVSDTHEIHHTPWVAVQAFTYCCFRYEPVQNADAV